MLQGESSTRPAREKWDGKKDGYRRMMTADIGRYAYDTPYLIVHFDVSALQALIHKNTGGPWSFGYCR